MKKIPCQFRALIFLLQELFVRRFDQLESLICHQQSKPFQHDASKSSQPNQLLSAATEVKLSSSNLIETVTLEQTAQHAVCEKICLGHNIEQSVSDFSDVTSFPAPIDQFTIDHAQDSLNLPLSNELKADFSSSNSSCLALPFSGQQWLNDTVFCGKSEQLYPNSEAQADAWKVTHHSCSMEQQTPHTVFVHISQSQPTDQEASSTAVPGLPSIGLHSVVAVEGSVDKFEVVNSTLRVDTTFEECNDCVSHVPFGLCNKDIDGNVLDFKQPELEHKAVADGHHVSSFEAILYAQNHCSHLGMSFTTANCLEVDSARGYVDCNALCSGQGVKHHDDWVGNCSISRCPAPATAYAEGDNVNIDKPGTMCNSVCETQKIDTEKGQSDCAGEGSGRSSLSGDFGGQGKGQIPSSHLSEDFSTVKVNPTARDCAAGGVFGVVTADLAWVTYLNGTSPP